MTNIKWFFLVIGLIFTSGCGDPIAKAVNEKFPPINVEEQRQTAINSTAQTLSNIKTPNIAFSIDLVHAEKVINNENLRKQGVTQMNLRSEKQLTHVRANFTKIFSEQEFGDNDEIKNFLKLLQPEISGTIDAYLGISSEVALNAANIPELQIKFLPGLTHLEVSKVKLADDIDATKVAEVLAKIINKYRDNITSELTKAPFAYLNIPALNEKSYDVSQTLKFTSQGNTFTASVNANPIKTPVKLANVVWLADNNRLTALLELSPIETTNTLTEVPVEKTFDAVNGQITGIISDSFGIEKLENTKIAVKKDLIAYVLNSAMKESAVSVGLAGNSHQETSSKIPMPNGDGIDCSSDRDCESKRVCNWEANHDTRDCYKCILWGFGGHCIQKGNDPFCEAAKAAQNLIYVTDANLRKADCERLRFQETESCKAEKLVEKTLCEAGKKTLDAIGKTGNFANVDTTANLKTDNLNVSFQDFHLSSSLDRVDINLNVKGNVDVDMNVKFVPLDIFGHLTCQFPWKESKHFVAGLRESKIPVGSTVNIDTSSGNAKINFVVDEMMIKGNLSPSPTEFLMTSPNMTVSCGGLNLIKPLVVTLTPFIKELRGDFDQKIDRQESSMDISMPTAKFERFELKTIADQTIQAIVVTGNIVEVNN